MRIRAIHFYVVLVSVLAALSLQLLSWKDLVTLPSDHMFGLLVLMAFGLLSERLSVGVTFTARTGHTITFIPLLATVLLFGPAAPVAYLLVTGGVAEVFLRKKEPIRAIFNLAQYTLATALAGWTFANLGGVAGLSVDGFKAQLLPFFAFLVVLMLMNHGAVSSAIAIDQQLPFRAVLQRVIGPAGSNAVYDMLVSPLAIVVAYFYSVAGSLGLLLSLLPLVFIRHAYLNTYRLEHANRDLLKALVKAIETRDPYTSGHSQRVSLLAGNIARAMSLSTRQIQTIEMAALLHDVGKIDIVYSEILRKPEDLTDDERRIIESHVTKGVELLRSLSSVPEEVIAAVRHHHEREDGCGYPDRLKGDRIPLAAKVIKVCDSVDAMLSDRPYRAALSRSEVEDQLARYAGQEFDPGVVKVVLESRLLEDHAASLRDDPTFTTEWRQTAWRGRLGLRRPPRRAVGQAW